jgi:branched-chain amino acid aminotransferase
MSVQFKIHRNPHPVSKVERAALLANPGFGRVFSDHMVTIRYADGRGWHDARVEPRGPIPMDPATAVLHYAQEIFEGLKAYLAADGGVTMFRPQANAARFRASAARMAMAELPEDLFIGSLRELVSIDRDWIPTGEDGSLYLRPFMYASEVFLGVRPSAEFLYVVVACPVGRTSREESPRSLSGYHRSTPGRRLAVPVPRSAAETTPPAYWPRRRPLTTAVTKWCSLTRCSAATSTNSEG